ncbi:N-acetylmuramic acid 6-phosphate etherase [Vibrio renipiscarius]|uniref:N-acetylmuramic acid 6-phosphate etherase n=1 Tax=Vibrio renipiscarius TaxID=1461322 RepID=A0A0C2NIN5_9VIBR|nr:N-acetylmuramic acid 6-phosphate etherase [Vibrio renipiscarius]KII79391.1 N-acetylmuramic acid-6-phosphate etherase [Vibrio renipiscarius]KII80981.1 N-acetylmuramic acid-6-phosphate etherase [Vibrio renipiscarius]
MKIDLSHLVTESRNESSQNIDILPTLEMLQVINTEDQKVALAVEKVLPEIAQVVDATKAAFSQGGRLIYMGAGTSGRLGILDASECPPTYGTPAEQVVGLIAGGHQAILKAVENAEDSPQLAVADLQALNLTDKDVVVGIAASGRTPYVIGGMEYARNTGAFVASIVCNPSCPMIAAADVAIVTIVGPEIVTGSSRMKAGTAQKLVLNMITTGAMIRSGKVFGNLMVDVEATNAKLIQRQANIVMEATGADEQEAELALAQCQRNCKTAILMILAGINAQEAKALLDQNDGFIRVALDCHHQSQQ